MTAADIGAPFGCFSPADPTGDFTRTALALRYRSGTPYLYSSGNAGNLVEYSIPSDGAIASCLGGSPTWVTATATQQFGDAYQSAIWTDHNTSTNPVTGIPNVVPTDLCWDDIDNRLYFTNLIDYDNITVTAPPVIGYTLLNDSTHVGTGVGIWRLSVGVGDGGYNNRWAGACKVIPSVFASQLGGLHLMIGPGGYHSIATNGPISMGPAAFAVDTTGFTAPTNRDYFAGTILPMQNHPYSAEAPPPLRTVRPTGIPGGANWIGEPGYPGTDTYWGWTDSSNGMVWINGPHKRGVLYAGQIFAGDAAMTVLASPAPTHTAFAVDALGPDVRVGYAILLHTDTTVSSGHYNFSMALITNINTSGAHPVLTVNTMFFGDSSGLDTTGIPIVGTVANCGQGYMGGGNWGSGEWDAFWIYDPDDFVKVSKGMLTPDAVLATSSGPLVVPGITFPTGGLYSGSEQPVKPVGAVYDSVTHRLYVMFYQGLPGSTGVQIVVYPVND